MASRTVLGRGLVLGYGGCKPPFTAVQWQELEKQTMIYKYLMAGLPVPPDLVRPIPHRFDELSARFSPRSALGYLSYYGKKFDSEPGRCRRTDGKKWRCSKVAYSESKYCERHMYKNRNRSRKPVESQPTSQSLSTAVSNISSEESSFLSNVTKLQMGPVSYGINNTECSYFMPTPVPDELCFSQEASTRVGRSIQESFSRLQGNSSAKQYMPRGFEPFNASFSNQPQHNFFGGDHTASPKQGNNPVQLFLSGTRESWSNLDNGRSSNDISSSTQLSISIPRSKNGDSSKRNL